VVFQAHSKHLRAVSGLHLLLSDRVHSCVMIRILRRSSRQIIEKYWPFVLSLEHRCNVHREQTSRRGVPSAIRPIGRWTCGGAVCTAVVFSACDRDEPQFHEWKNLQTKALSTRSRYDIPLLCFVHQLQGQTKTSVADPLPHGGTFHWLCRLLSGCFGVDHIYSGYDILDM
jgi:hypothetical protein